MSKCSLPGQVQLAKSLRQPRYAALPLLASLEGDRFILGPVSDQAAPCRCLEALRYLGWASGTFVYRRKWRNWTESILQAPWAIMERCVCLQHPSLEESPFRGTFLFPDTIKKSLKVNLQCTCPALKTKGTSVNLFLSHANILPPISHFWVFVESAGNKEPRNTTPPNSDSQWLPCSGTLLSWWPGPGGVTSSEGTQSSKAAHPMEKGSCSQTTTHLHHRLLLPHHKFSGVRNVTGRSGIVFLSYFCSQPRREL